jgi:hypothetical protein
VFLLLVKQRHVIRVVASRYVDHFPCVGFPTRPGGILQNWIRNRRLQRIAHRLFPRITPYCVALAYDKPGINQGLRGLHSSYSLPLAPYPVRGTCIMYHVQLKVGTRASRGEKRCCTRKTMIQEGVEALVCYSFQMRRQLQAPRAHALVSQQAVPQQHPPL